MLASENLLKPKTLQTMERFGVGRDLSGGVKLICGPVEHVLSPADAIKLGVAIMEAAGAKMQFTPTPGRPS